KQVFAYLQDLRTHPLWNSGLLSVAPIVQLKPGASYVTRNHQMGQSFEAHNVVAEFVPDRRLVITNDSGPLQYQVSFEVQPSPAGCRVNYRARLTSYLSIFGFAEGVLDFMIGNKLRGDLASLKALVEKNQH